MGKKVALKYGGKPFRLSPEKAVRSFLDSAPVDEFFPLKYVAQKAEINYETLLGINLHDLPEMAPYTHKKKKGYIMPNCRRAWGNPKAIAELRRQVGA